MESNYALIELSSGLVVNLIVLEENSGWVDPEGFITVQTDMASIGWKYVNGQFISPEPDPPTYEELAASARGERDQLLKTTYDPGIMMALRALRMASTPDQEAYAKGKVEELDAYAEALVAIPDQPGFPQTIVWPEAPTK
jgi:hypothetical protein